ncbi:hypothetical protein CRYPA_1581 [uncultured Candidatus Thioglobus sp.]|nr:hypothetical protein CRYPA_1581 [uncultured Candidatus Thioglobus sp.]
MGENKKQPCPSFIHNQTLLRFMNILNYKLDTTKELLTSRIGLLATAHTINKLKFTS